MTRSVVDRALGELSRGVVSQDVPLWFDRVRAFYKALCEGVNPDGTHLQQALIVECMIDAADYSGWYVDREDIEEDIRSDPNMAGKAVVWADLNMGSEGTPFPPRLYRCYYGVSADLYQRFEDAAREQLG